MEDRGKNLNPQFSPVKNLKIDLWSTFGVSSEESIGPREQLREELYVQRADFKKQVETHLAKVSILTVVFPYPQLSPRINKTLKVKTQFISRI